MNWAAAQAIICAFKLDTGVKKWQKIEAIYREFETLRARLTKRRRRSVSVAHFVLNY
jgi:hypothetical protein